eukprot:NODE_8963_length_532_cov_36.202469_g8940_i0.p3 GENE.NODE_8963_length_532_cov_36.202469_g8940_i0~~NODE_8963_length_532_cov_36.202469_g8940_i0.p3  ORF type:complete len:133 (+),score=29.40 NODE_8963_length_532_cov_36.202469_g8940_i0:93-491(+)
MPAIDCGSDDSDDWDGPVGEKDKHAKVNKLDDRKECVPGSKVFVAKTKVQDGGIELEFWNESGSPAVVSVNLKDNQNINITGGTHGKVDASAKTVEVTLEDGASSVLGCKMEPADRKQAVIVNRIGYGVKKG